MSNLQKFTGAAVAVLHREEDGRTAPVVNCEADGTGTRTKGTRPASVRGFAPSALQISRAKVAAASLLPAAGCSSAARDSFSAANAAAVQPTNQKGRW